MKQKILASSTAIVQLLMSLVPTALAVKADAKKNFPQQHQLQLQQQLMIHQVIVLLRICLLLHTKKLKKNII
jgi:hypothetical protein